MSYSISSAFGAMDFTTRRAASTFGRTAGGNSWSIDVLLSADCSRGVGIDRGASYYWLQLRFTT
jgi:hypothetical protein